MIEKVRSIAIKYPLGLQKAERLRGLIDRRSRAGQARDAPSIAAERSLATNRKIANGLRRYACLRSFKMPLVLVIAAPRTQILHRADRPLRPWLCSQP
jgi:hypothetical protein